MFVHYARWYLSVSWILLVLLTFLEADATSAGSVTLVAVGAIVPPLIMLSLWHDRPTITITETLHTVARR